MKIFFFLEITIVQTKSASECCLSAFEKLEVNVNKVLSLFEVSDKSGACNYLSQGTKTYNGKNAASQAI